MKGPSWAEIQNFIDGYLSRAYGRRMNPWFQGKVASVTSSTTGVTVTITRTGESATDGVSYQVAPGYTPTVGDVVDCQWRDNASAYVMFPVGSAAGSAKAGPIITASETTTSGTYADLATVGPTVSIITGTQAWVTLSARIANSTAGSFAFMGFAINGVLPADDTQAIGHNIGNSQVAGGAAFLVTGLTPGVNVFLAKYRVTGNTGTFLSRRIAAQPA